MTALVHRFAERLRGEEVQSDEQAAWDEMASAARTEVAALCVLPATRADELSPIDDLNQYCASPRPDRLRGPELSAVSQAEDRLAAAIDALPVR